MSIFPEEYTEPTPLSKFVGKVCTVLVDKLSDVQSQMTPEETTQTFTGIVNTIDAKGVCITDLVDKTHNYFFFNHIVALREEKILDPNNPEHQQEIQMVQKAAELKQQEIEKKKPKPQPQNDNKVEQLELTGKETAFVDIQSLQKLAQNSKRNLT